MLKSTRLLLGSAGVAAAIAVTTVATPAFAFNPLITVDENGHGVLGFVPPTPLTGVLMADPGPGGLSSVLTYDLLGPPSLTAGDVLVFDHGVFEDVIRFNPAGTGGVAGYPASLLLYSNPVDGFDSLADTPSPPLSFYSNTVSVTETNVGGVDFIDYHPSDGQPGFVAGFDVAYDVTSDVPELSTWAMMLAGFAFLGYAGYRGRPSSVAAAV
jgi:hypothetical protein